MRVLLMALVGLAVLGGAGALVEQHSGDSASPLLASSTTAPAGATTAVPATLPDTTSQPIPETTSTVATTVPPITVPPITVPPEPSAPCPASPHGAVVDRATQRAWLCDGGVQTRVFPITSANSLPDPGEFTVYAKDMNATSRFGGHLSRMTHFVAFTYGENTGARVAFHSVPTLSDGSYVQPLSSVGELDRRGESAGCIRVVPTDAQAVWDWLSIGDDVWVIS